MVFTELASTEELTEFLNENSNACVITFSATWCGPCKASKPKLKEFAESSPVPIGYVHEEDLEDFLEVFIQINAFPTYVLFKEGKEVSRVEGVDFASLQAMVAKA